jgi:hypothetical protein
MSSFFIMCSVLSLQFCVNKFSFCTVYVGVAVGESR